MPSACSAVLVATISGSLLAGTVRAQSSDADALRGPSIKEAPKPTSLVKRDMSGNLERLDTRPEQAALDLLGLTPEQRKAPEQVLSVRYAAVTKLLQENQALFIQLQQARQGGAAPDELRPLMRRMQEAAAPLLNKPLQQEVEATLPTDKQSEFRTIVEEYKRASAAEEPPSARGRQGAGDQRTTRGAAIPRRVELNLLLREMARALNAIVVERRENTDALLKTVDATPEQEAQIRAILRSANESPQGEPGSGTGAAERTPEQRRAVWDKILALLTPEQRRKALEYRRSH